MVRQYVGARYVPKFADPTAWASGTSYEAMTIVTYNNSSYTSKITVPATVGNPADNPDYWALTGNYNAQVEQYRQETETVSNNLTTEITNRKNADTTLQGQITTVSDNLTTEITNRKNANTTLQGQITTVSNNLTTEITNRKNADTTLQNNINAEAAARQTANNILQGNINSEAATRASADSNLQSQITQIIAPSGEAPSAAEVQNARIGADGVTYDTLGNAIRGQVGVLSKSITDNMNNEGYFYETFDYTREKFYYNKTGKETSTYDFSLGLNVENTPYVKIKFNGSQYFNFYTFTDSAGTVIDYLRCEKDNEEFNKILRVPANATNLYISGHNINSYKIVHFYLYEYAVKRNFKEEILTPYLCRYWYQNGGINETPEYYSSTEINCEHFTKIIISGTVSSYYNYYTFLNENKTPILYDRVDATPYTFSNLELNVPPSAVYMNVSGTDNVTYKGVAPISVFNEREIEKQNAKNQLNNKNIYWIGTSIPAGGLDGLPSYVNYPKLVGKRIHANVTNLSVGSSTVHCRRKSLVSDENPYGFIDNFEGASRCLSNTIEMDQWIIDNYRTFSNAPSTLSDKDKQFILSCSYENRILPRLTNNDIWVFDHGFNDFMGDENLYDEKDSTSTFTFKGACNFIFNEILSKQPKSSIYMIGVTCYGIRSVQAEGQIDVANEWNFPILKLWEYLGWSEKEITTTGSWVDGKWVDNSVPNGHKMKLREIALPDGIHPHTDLSNGALNQISMICAKWLLLNGYWKPISHDELVNYWP